MKKLYLIGGRPCSGKTTFAYRLGLLTNFKVIYLDVFANEVVSMSTKEKKELFKWKTNNMIDILQEEPEKLCEDYLKFYDELFPYLVEYINLFEDTNIILESALLLPKYINELSNMFSVSSIFLHTSDSFVYKTYPKRDYAIELSKSNKGKIALDHLLKRDSLFAKMLLKDIYDYNYDVIEVRKEEDFVKGFNDVIDNLGLKDSVLSFIITNEYRHLKKEARKDKKLMSSILHDDFIECGRTRKWNKIEVLNQMPLEIMNYDIKPYNYDFEHEFLTFTYCLNINNEEYDVKSTWIIENSNFYLYKYVFISD